MILDTNALSAFVDGDPALRPHVETAPVLMIPVIVLGEFRYGIGRSSRRDQYDAWLAGHLPAFRILDVTQQTAEIYADIRLQLREDGSPIPENDVWIAALVREVAQPLLSRDAHFRHVRGLDVIDW